MEGLGADVDEGVFGKIDNFSVAVTPRSVISLLEARQYCFQLSGQGVSSSLVSSYMGKFH